MMFWSATLPSDAMSGEASVLAAARAGLSRAAGGCDVTSDAPWSLCDSMHSVQGWEVFSCGDSLPNTRWHIMRNSEGVWAAWRVHKVRPSAVHGRYWDSMEHAVRSEHLVDSVATSPLAESVTGLMDEIIRQGHGLPGFPNTYPFGEVHAASLVLGMDHSDADVVRFLEAMGGLSEEEALFGSQGGLTLARKSHPLPRERAAWAAAEATERASRRR